MRYTIETDFRGITTKVRREDGTEVTDIVLIQLIIVPNALGTILIQHSTGATETGEVDPNGGIVRLFCGTWEQQEVFA